MNDTDRPSDEKARIDALLQSGDQPVSLALAPKHYLSGLRADNLIDGLIGGSIGVTGGGWTNHVTGHGTFARDKVLQGSFQEPFRITDQELSALYNGNDIAKRIITSVPREMFRRGWVLVLPEDDAKDEGDIAQSVQETGTGGESGPASPGAPLVDPVGESPTNSGATQPTVARQLAPAGGTGDYDLMGQPRVAAPSVTPLKPAQPDQESGGPTGAPAPKTAMGVAPNPDPVASGKTSKTLPKPAPGESNQVTQANLALQVEAYAARLSLIPRALEACIFGRAYGGGLLIIGADDARDMSTPLDEANIRTIRYLTWVDRRFIFARTWYTEIGPKYGEVETWEIINPFGGQANTYVHETRVVRFDGAPVDFLMRRRLLGWTLSVLQAPYDTMRQFDMSFQSIANLMADLSQAVMKIDGLAQMISNDQKTLQTRMQMVDISRSSARMLFLDAEHETFERTVTPLTGVPETLEMQMLRLAAAAEMPVAILFGREPSGLNATGDADFRRFYDVIRGTQRADLEPKLRRIYSLICLAKDSPTKGKLPDRGLEFIWHKLYEPTEKEQAEIRWLMAQADDKYVADGVLLPEEVATSRFRSGELHLDTEIDFELREEALAHAQLAPSGAEKAQNEHDQNLALATAKGAAKPGSPAPGGTPPKIGTSGPSRGPATPAKRGDAWDHARVDAAVDDVHDLMSEDFPDEAIAWVKDAPWRGPMRVPLSSVDFSNRDSWHASRESDKPRVEKFQDMIETGEGVKPVILVMRPRGKAMIVDGHHRALAHWKNGETKMLAYVAKVGEQKGPWDTTHEAQNEGLSGASG